MMVGSIQPCVGQEAPCEAGIHATKTLFQDEGVEANDDQAMPIVDASNVFNSLNREQP